jgi:hypothetical protein
MELGKIKHLQRYGIHVVMFSKQTTERFLFMYSMALSRRCASASSTSLLKTKQANCSWGEIMHFKARSNFIIRLLILFLGGLGVILTVGFFWRLPWATRLWPWADSPLSYVWLASICAAIAAPIIWIALSGELGATSGGSLNLLVTAIGATVSLLFFYPSGDQHSATGLVIVFVISILILAGVTWWASRLPIRDTRPMPRPIFISFIVFALLLIATATGLVLRVPTIFPWALLPETSVLFGWFFAGAAFYFAYGVARPSWHNACGQLLGFLAYDLILIVPFIGHFATVTSDHLLSLSIYVVVLIYSGGLAIYYLFLNKTTWLWTSASGQSLKSAS